MKIVLDVAKLVEEGEITSEQAEHLKKLAGKETGSLAINILLSLGVIAIASGILALEPSVTTILVVGAALMGSGLLVRHYRPVQWGLLGSAILLVGALAVSGGVLILFDGHWAAFLLVAVLLLLVGIVARNGLPIALSVLAFATILGSSTGYWHASYMLVVREPSITLATFALLAWGTFHLSQQLPSQYERLALIFSRMSLILVNFGFWVGSLWGDYPGESWAQSQIFENLDTFGESYERLEGWREGALFISDVTFAVLWALGLLAVGVWGAKRNRRFVVNTVAVFGSIHFYTQWFENLGATPLTVIAGGAVAVALAVGFWRYNMSLAAKGVSG